jgi:hypothetical protein
MKCAYAAVLAIGCVIVGHGPVFAQFKGPKGGKGSDQQAAKYGWLSSLEQGKAEARKTGKPLMVVIRCVP